MNIVFISLGVNTQEWNARSYAKYMFIGKFQNVSQDAIPFCIPTRLAFLPVLLIVRILVSLSLILAMLIDVYWYFAAIWICIPQVAGDVEYLFMCFWHVYPLWWNVQIFCQFLKTGLFVYKLLSWENSLYILGERKYTSDVFLFFSNIFSVCVLCFHFLNKIFIRAKVFVFIKFNLSVLLLWIVLLVLY